MFLNYLDQRALGFSMRVERATTDKVKDRIEMLKRKINDQKSAPVTSALDDYNSRLATQVAEQERLKRQKKEELTARKKEKEAAEAEEIDPEIAAMMGFGGFGGYKK
jgi:U4/U6.U5 tri-snRNP component SNU23